MSFQNTNSIKDNPILSRNQIGYGNASVKTKDINFIKNDTTHNYGGLNASVTDNNIGSKNQMGMVNVKANFGDVSVLGKKTVHNYNTYNTNNQNIYNTNTHNITIQSIQQSRKLLQVVMTKNQYNNSVSDMLDSLSKIATIASLYVPQAGFVGHGLKLLAELMNFCCGTQSPDDEKQSHDRNFISLVQMAISNVYLNEAKGHLKFLSTQIKQESFSMTNGKDATGRDIWLRARQRVYKAYDKEISTIYSKLYACVKTLNFKETNIEAATHTVNQIVSLVGLLYFRYIIYSAVAFIFGDSISDHKIMNLLQQTTQELISPFKVLSKPKVENRIIVTLFYSNIDSSAVIQCLQFFDKSFVFVNPEHDLCPNWDQENNKKSPYFRLFCKKWPGRCIGISKGNGNREWIQCTNKLNTENFHVGHLGLKRANTIHDNNAFGKYELLMTPKATSGCEPFRIAYESARNYFHTEEWEMNVLHMKLERYLLESMISKVSTYCHEFIIFKTFTDEDSFYYIALKDKPEQYVYLDYFGFLRLYDSIKSPPTLEGQWKFLPPIDNTRRINVITIVNDLDEAIKNV
eukprot:454522_1